MLKAAKLQSFKASKMKLTVNLHVKYTVTKNKDSLAKINCTTSKLYDKLISCKESIYPLGLLNLLMISSNDFLFTKPS